MGALCSRRHACARAPCPPQNASGQGDSGGAAARSLLLLGAPSPPALSLTRTDTDGVPGSPLIRGWFYLPLLSAGAVARVGRKDRRRRSHRGRCVGGLNRRTLHSANHRRAFLAVKRKENIFSQSQTCISGGIEKREHKQLFHPSISQWVLSGELLSVVHTRHSIPSQHRATG